MSLAEEPLGLQQVYSLLRRGRPPKKEPSAGIRSLQGRWATAANSLDKQAQGDDSGVAPQTCTTPKGVGICVQHRKEWR